MTNMFLYVYKEFIVFRFELPDQILTPFSSWTVGLFLTDFLLKLFIYSKK